MNLRMMADAYDSRKNIREVQCPICGKVFKSFFTAGEFGKSPPKRDCPQCGVRFPII